MIKELFLAEYMKMKKICFWIPAIGAFIFLLFTCMEWYLYFRQGEGGIYTGLNVVYMFLSFEILLTTSLLCSIMSETEHQAQSLKMFFSMPVKRGSFYLVKAVWVILFVLECCIFIIGGVCIIWILYTDKVLPFSFLIKQILGCFGASLPVLAIQLFLSLFFTNQTFPLAVGVLGSISSLFLGRIGKKIMYFLPWAYPSMASPFIEGYTNWIILGGLLGIIFLIAGSIAFTKMEIK